MRIAKVTAHAFGPFTEETLQLAPGMTVISGPNEAGKSSWHAAIYAGLCGMRRGRGRRQRDDEVFADRHRPWDRDGWDVSCEIELQDGRRVELRHDLLGNVECGARDLSLGTDVSDEIIYDGAPDGARWLGLDRRTFLAVACVRQAEILGVTQYAEALQEHLQRAAATAGTDETAATALVVIDQFRREAIGLRRSNSTRPLQAAIARRQMAARHRERAFNEHGAWLVHQEKVASLDAAAAEADKALDAAEGLILRRQVDAKHKRLDEAKALAERYPHPPPDLADDDSLAERVAAAVIAWEQRPTRMVLEGPSAIELQGQLDELPRMPKGDLEPDLSVTSAVRRLREAVSDLNAHRRHRPDVEPVDTSGASGSELLAVARGLEEVIPDVDERLRAEVDRLSEGSSQQKVPQSVRSRGIGAASALGVVGAILVALDQPVAGLVCLAAGLIVGLRVTGVLVRPSRLHHDGDEPLRAARTRLVVAEQMLDAAVQRRSTAVARAMDLGLPADANLLRNLADAADRYERSITEIDSWRAGDEGLAHSFEEARVAMIDALRSRSVEVGTDFGGPQLEAAFTSYEEDCRDRQELAARARRRPDVERALAARQREEARHHLDGQRLTEAEGQLRDVSRLALAVPEDDVAYALPDELTAMLTSWQGERSHQRAASHEAQRQWARLEAILEGRSIVELETELESDIRLVEELSRLSDDGPASPIHLGSDPDQGVRKLREEAQAKRQEAAAAASELRLRAEQAISVPEAEEEWDAAAKDLERLERLEETIELTTRYLSEAQERVHRDIAPVLQAKVQDRLARVTGGRYSEVIVDPRELNVTVREAGGQWRTAALLSHGTAEQVYLLLRIAMAEILTEMNSACPLLLDDVTVQSDPERSRAVLDVLHEASHDHQIVLFTQEAVVVEWARTHLGDRDTLISLGPRQTRSDPTLRGIR